MHAVGVQRFSTTKLKIRRGALENRPFPLVIIADCFFPEELTSRVFHCHIKWFEPPGFGFDPLGFASLSHIPVGFDGQESQLRLEAEAAGRCQKAGFDSQRSRHWIYVRRELKKVRSASLGFQHVCFKIAHTHKKYTDILKAVR